MDEGNSALINGLYSAVDNGVEERFRTHPLIGKLLSEDFQYNTLHEDQKEEANRDFQAIYSDLGSLEEYINQYIERKKTRVEDETVRSVTNDSSNPCMSSPFDPKKQRYAPIVIAPTKTKVKGRQEDFDVYKFIIRKEEENQVYRLNIDQNADEAYLDLSYEERHMQDNQADYAHRKIVRILNILNNNSDYKILDYFAERRIQ